MNATTSRPDSSSPITVLYADDHNLVRQCVVAVLEREEGVRVVAEVRTVKDAFDDFCRTRPDVTLVSLHPRGLDCLQVVRAIREVDPAARIIVYAREETEAIYLALEAGASGFVLESAVTADLVRVLMDVPGRHGVLPEDTRRRLGARVGMPSLTTREVEILNLFTEGLRTKAIAATLRISDHTVKAHAKSVYEKLGVQGRAAALAEALRRGVVRLPSGRHVRRNENLRYDRAGALPVA
jgi:DNA-binding NarL/FixJ family response regulator